MTSHPTPDEAIGDLLEQIAEVLGSSVPVPLRAALQAVPRHLFLPPTVWVRGGKGSYERYDREQDPDRWWSVAYRDAPLVTQFTELSDGDAVPSSSASMPSMVVRMLTDLDVRPGHRVLEIGTGTGFNAALLSRLVGAESVTTLDIDPRLTAEAQRALQASGQQPEVVCADGAEGWRPNAPYDRIISTCSVRTVPLAWLEEISPGGLIVTPWDTAWCTFGTLIATGQADGTAEGALVPYGSFMLMRAQQADVELHRDLLRDDQVPDRSVTELSPWSVAGSDFDAQMHIGLHVPGVWHAWDTDVQEAHTRLWLADDRATSWARVDYDGRQMSTFAVAQYGPRRLWDEVARAHEQYVSAGRPGIARHRLRISPDGTSTRHEVRLA